MRPRRIPPAPDGRDDATIRWLLDQRGIRPTVEPFPPPAEDAYEPNDDAIEAPDLDPGQFERLRLEGEDWFRVAVPALRRRRVTVFSDARDGDVAVELVTAAGRRIDVSESLDGTDTAIADAGRDGHRVRRRRGRGR